jgi:hypothetical protein
MPGGFQLGGAPPQKNPRYVALYNSRYWSGYSTNRSPLRSAGSAYEERYLGTRADSIIDGSNCEITPKLTLARRPGNPVYNSNTFDTVDAFYSFREFAVGTEQIRVMVDTVTALYDGTANGKILVFTKSAGAGQTFMQSVGNNLFFANGVDQKKWVQTLFTRVASGPLPAIGNSTTLNPVSTPFLTTYVIDNNGNLQQLLATSITTITNVAYTAPTLTLTVGSTAGITPGTNYGIWNMATATWLNGITINVVTAAGTTVTATLVNATHADYASAADTGNFAVAIGGSPVTGGSVPTWNTTVPAAGNDYQGGITVDGTALWVNRGNPVENWGIASGTTAPTVTVGAASAAWHSNTYYSLPGVVVDTRSSNNNIWQATTTGTTGATISFPTSPAVNDTFTEGTIVWKCVATTATAVWASHTNFASGALIVETTGGVPCLFQLAIAPASVQLSTLMTAKFVAHSASGVFDGDWGGSVGNPVSFGTATPLVIAATASSINSLLWNYYNTSAQPILQYTLNGAGESSAGSSTTPWAGATTNWEMMLFGAFTVNQPGPVSFLIAHDDGFYLGMDNGSTYVSGPNTGLSTRTLSPWNGYPLVGGNNVAGDFSAGETLTVNCPTTGTYHFEFAYAQKDVFQVLAVTANGAQITPTPLETGTTIPSFPAFSKAFAPNYASVTETQLGNPGVPSVPGSKAYTWSNIGPVTDFAWRAKVAVTLANTTITDSNNNTEAPFEAGVSGTVAPTWATGINQLTNDNPNLVWINKGPATAPAPGTISAFAGGFQYYVALVNTMTNTVSNASPANARTGNFIGASGITVTGGLPPTASIDPQADYVAIFRTTDGGAIPFLIPGTLNSIYTVPLSQYLQNGYLDTTPDTGLNNLIEAPILGENTPPANGAQNLTYHLSRIFFSVGNVVYWTSGPDTPVGNGIEGVAPANTQVFPSIVKRLVPTTAGLFVFTVSDIYVIIGQGSPENPIQPAYPYLKSIGLSSYNALDINGADMGFYSTDRRFIILNPSTGPGDVGFSVGNTISSITPANAYVAWYSSGEDSGWFLADGSTGWYRVSPTPAPEQGITWSPFATIVGGVKAIASIETVPGVTNLLLGPVTSGPILKRSITSFQDNTSNYTWFATVGSHVLANPGQLAEVGFIATDCVATGTRPSISVLFNEAVPFYTGPFSPINNWTADPPTIAESTSMYAQRFYMSETGQPAVCRSMQWRIDFPAENYFNELLSTTIWGCLLVES